jgi:dihydrofolate synthase/folylpolyglutamate synthase
MRYQDAVEFLLNRPVRFVSKSKLAYEAEGLENFKQLDRLLGAKHQFYKTVHIAGTNGKGSVASLMASVLKSAGYKVGLYTSPHLIDLTERIRVNGAKIPQNKVAEFVQQHQDLLIAHQTNFFACMTLLAWDFFATEKVDVAIIETGVGGRLDQTNIINPVLSVITRIALDHTELLGKDIASIAKEKAGIIKENTTVVVGLRQIETQEIFAQIANKKNAEIIYPNTQKKYPKSALKGNFQTENERTAYTTLQVLQKNHFTKIQQDHIEQGFAQTQWHGRYETWQESPKIIADIAHNADGLDALLRALAEEKYENLHIVLGFSANKSIEKMLEKMPKSAQYYVSAAKNNRALSEKLLYESMLAMNFAVQCFDDATRAFYAAQKNAKTTDLVLVTGSNFLVGEIYEKAFGDLKKNA